MTTSPRSFCVYFFDLLTILDSQYAARSFACSPFTRSNGPIPSQKARTSGRVKASQDHWSRLFGVGAFFRQRLPPTRRWSVGAITSSTDETVTRGPLKVLLASMPIQPSPSMMPAIQCRSSTESEAIR